MPASISPTSNGNYPSQSTLKLQQSLMKHPLKPATQATAPVTTSLQKSSGIVFSPKAVASQQAINPENATSLVQQK